MLAFTTTFNGLNCSDYEIVGIGESMALHKGAGARSEGGGVLENSFAIGIHETAGAFVDSSNEHMVYTPRFYQTTVPVVMPQMKNETVTFTMGINFMLNPTKTWIIYSQFKNYQQAVERHFRSACLEELGRLDLGLNIDDDSITPMIDRTAAQIADQATARATLSFESRAKVSAKILTNFKDRFKTSHPEFYTCFYFIGVSSGNVQFSDPLLQAFSKAVTESYNTETLTIEGEAAKLRGQIQVEKSKGTMVASAIEAGALTDAVMQYRGREIIEGLITDDDIDVTMIITVDEHGNIVWFKVNEDNQKNPDKPVRSATIDFEQVEEVQ